MAGSGRGRQVAVLAAGVGLLGAWAVGSSYLIGDRSDSNKTAVGLADGVSTTSSAAPTTAATSSTKASSANTAASSTTATPASKPPTTTAPSTAAPTTAAPATAAAPTTKAAVPATTAPPTSPAPTSAPAAGSPAPSGASTHFATYKGGKLYMQGSVPTRADADKFVAKAAEVIGAENVIDQYVIDPAAPPASDGFIRVDEPFLFRTDSATIDLDYTPVLNLGVLVMKLNPHARMVITGHTDTVGDPEYNKDLSQRRARAVADWMSANGGIALDRFDLVGAGSAVPIGSNDTPEGRAANRRIEVTLVGLLSA